MLDVIRMCEIAKYIASETRIDNLRKLWMSYRPFMAMGFLKDMNFEDFKEQSTIRIDTRSNEEILAEVAEIRKKQNMEG